MTRWVASSGQRLEQGGCAGVREPDVAAAALGLASGELRLPRIAVTDLPLTTLGGRGLYHLDIRRALAVIWHFLLLWCNFLTFPVQDRQANCEFLLTELYPPIHQESLSLS